MIFFGLAACQARPSSLAPEFPWASGLAKSSEAALAGGERPGASDLQPGLPSMPGWASSLGAGYGSRDLGADGFRPPWSVDWAARGEPPSRCELLRNEPGSGVWPPVRSSSRSPSRGSGASDPHGRRPGEGGRLGAPQSSRIWGSPGANEGIPLRSWGAPPTVIEGQLGAKRIDRNTLGLRLPDIPAKAPQADLIEVELCRGDQVEAIAARYGLEFKDLYAHNRRISKWRRPKILRLRPKRWRPPRMKTKFLTVRGETWASIAQAVGLEEEELRKMNGARRRPLKSGRKIQVCAESALPGWYRPNASKPPIELYLPYGAESMGRPSNGWIRRSVAFPKSVDYNVNNPKSAFASTRTIALTHYAIALFRRRTGFDGDVRITSVSRRGGGRFPPHRSHQSGRDVDIRLVAFPGFAHLPYPASRRIDWGATWALLRALIDTGQVEQVFLSYSRQPALYRAAKMMGESAEDLDRLIQYPRGRGKHRGLVRHSNGHEAHFHIRFACGPDEKSCR